MAGKIFGLHVGLQEAEIKHWCFGRCGDILMGVLVDEEMGELAPCKTELCPHEEGRVEVGTVADGVVWVRKLVSVKV